MGRGADPCLSHGSLYTLRHIESTGWRCLACLSGTRLTARRCCQPCIGASLARTTGVARGSIRDWTQRKRSKSSIKPRILSLPPCFPHIGSCDRKRWRSAGAQTREEWPRTADVMSRMPMSGLSADCAAVCCMPTTTWTGRRGQFSRARHHVISLHHDMSCGAERPE